MSKVSVIVPNFNYAKYLQIRLESIFNQTYKDIELIFLDDASTDDSIAVFNKIIFKYPDIKYKILLNKDNSGIPFVQWNRGVTEASGEYIWIAEADDYCEPYFLETLVNVLDSNTSVGIAYCQSCHVDESNNKLGDLLWSVEWLDNKRWKEDYTNSGRDEILNYLSFQNTIPNASGVVFRKSVYVRSGMADVSMRLMGDWVTWIKMLFISDIYYSKNVMNFFRVHAKSIRNEYDSSKEIKYILETIKTFSYIRKNLNIDYHQTNKMSVHLCRIIYHKIIEGRSFSCWIFGFLKIFRHLLSFNPLIVSVFFKVLFEYKRNK